MNFYDILLARCLCCNSGGASPHLKSASGDIITITDGADNMPLFSAVVNIEPVQDLYGYDYPWPAGGGTNKIAWPDGIDFTLNGVRYYVSDGKLFLNGTSSGETSSNDGTFETNFKFKLPAGTYYFTRGSFPNATYLIHNEDGVRRAIVINNGVFTLSAEEELWVGFYVYRKTFSNLHAPIQIVQGSTEPATFAPYSNICPISGWSQVDGKQTGANLSEKTSVNNTTLCLVKKGVTYTFGCDNIGYVGLSLKKNTNAGDKLAELSPTTAAHISLTFTPDEDCRVFINGYRQGSSGPTFAESVSNFMISVGSTDAPYSAYNATPITIPLGQTVYGGTLDLVRGKLVVDRGYTTITAFSSKSGTTANQVYAYQGISGTVKKASADTATVDILSDKFVKSHFGGAGGLYGTAKLGIAVNTNGTVYVGFGKDGVSTLADANTWVAANPIQVVYPLATPIEVDLTPQTIKTLLGINNIWADAGSMAIEYVAVS